MKNIFKKIDKKLPNKIIVIIVLAVFLTIFPENQNNTQNLNNTVISSGVRTADDIYGEIRFHIVTMKYKFHLKKITPPSESVIVRVSIDKYGNTTFPEILAPDTLSEPAREIILEDLLGWKFVQISEEGQTNASFPLNLKNRLNQ